MPQINIDVINIFLRQILKCLMFKYIFLLTVYANKFPLKLFKEILI